MEVISAREFRTNQSKYLDMVKRGEEVILKSRGLGSFHIRPITTQEVVVNKTDLMFICSVYINNDYYCI